MTIKIGKKYGRLTIIEEIAKKHKGQRRVLCQCDCGKKHNVNHGSLIYGGTKSCGCIKIELRKSQTGCNSLVWKGGRRVNNGGYVLILKPDHPKCNEPYVLEHRLVMEKHLGRYLVDKENVHHINGNKEDNRVENLELWNASQPPGQRVEDKLKWAKEIIKLYEK